MAFRQRLPCKFQFTPLREGRRGWLMEEFERRISIHAPPRGATVAALTEDGDELISIHAPPRGATQSSHKRLQHCRFQFTPLREGRRGAPSCRNAGRYFNSRPSARGDRKAGGLEIVYNISIHAPPRGATHRYLFLTKNPANFNSRPSARGDRVKTHVIRGARNFNSRPSARGDPDVAHRLAECPDFNSRPSARGDR